MNKFKKYYWRIEYLIKIINIYLDFEEKIIRDFKLKLLKDDYYNDYSYILSKDNKWITFKRTPKIKNDK